MLELSIEQIEALGMQCRVNTLTYDARHFIYRIRLSHLINQFAQDLILIVLLAEELSIDRCAQTLAKDKPYRNCGCNKQIKVERIAKQNLVKRAMTVRDDGH